MVLVLMVSAVFCAVATFVAVRLLVDRSNPEVVRFANLQEVTVEGMVIRLDIDPEKAVYLPQEFVQGGIPEAATPPAPVAVQPTPTPPPPTITPSPTPVPDPVIFKEYVVQQGDSLYKIGREQNSSIELMALYGIDGDDMVPGKTLSSLPYANPAYCPGNRAYVVRDHDTLHGIANAFNTTPQAILELNGFDANYTIRTTEVICIPTG
jgi:LysM repeat protein